MKTKFLMGYQVVVCLLAILFVNNAFAQWPQWRGPLRDGMCTETNLLKIWPVDGPKLLWSVNSVGDGFSSTAIEDQMIYTIGKRDSVEILTALDLNGNLKWQKAIGPASKDKEFPQSRTTPTVYKNKVYAITVLGDAACFDCQTGNTVWKMAAFKKFIGAGENPVLNGTAESPLLFDDKMIITPCGNNTTMVAINCLTGETIWQTESLQDSTSFSSPILISVNNNKAIFRPTLKHDLIDDGSTGKIIWKERRIPGTIPLVMNNQIFFTGEFSPGTLCSWNNEWNQRSIVWTDSVKGNFMGGAILFDGKIVMSSLIKGIYCLDPKTGKILSSYEPMTACNFLFADNMLYTYEDKMGRLALFKMNGNDLQLVSSFKITEGKGPRLAHLAIANGVLFVRRGEVLMAYDIKQDIHHP
jgi:outer membrane protein assembly factor BamB